jgi:hypothetical protein
MAVAGLGDTAASGRLTARSLARDQAEWAMRAQIQKPGRVPAGLDGAKMFPRRSLRSRHRGVMLRCHLVIILNATGLEIMATGNRSPFDPFASHRSALASYLAAAVLLPAAALAAPPPAPVPSPGFTITVFAGPLAGSTAPDSIAVVGNAVVGNSVWVAYGNGGNPDGTGGAMSQIVEYTSAGKVKRNLTVTGHNDGLRLNPATNQLWALQNEDANPNLVVIDPVMGNMVKFTFAGTPPHGGGYDDIVFVKGAAFLSASHPTLDAKGNSIGPSIVLASLVVANHTVVVAPVLSGTPPALNIPFGTVSRLNLTDPDSMILTPTGEVLLDDQGDGQLVFASPKSLRVLPLLGTVQVDDTVFATSRHGVLLVADRGANTIYAVTTPVWPLNAAYSAVTNMTGTAFAPYVGQLDLTSGAVLPVVTNLVSPHGMAFVGF